MQQSRCLEIPVRLNGPVRKDAEVESDLEFAGFSWVDGEQGAPCSPHLREAVHKAAGRRAELGVPRLAQGRVAS
ncbi:hypothetical protein ARTHRO9AX_10217 [Arthrobacter sp. 9AX]|nr:hypothetical protein ARTHRO9AX_10217 [Arthrobacter sp. 9AX]